MPRQRSVFGRHTSGDTPQGVDLSAYTLLFVLALCLVELGLVLFGYETSSRIRSSLNSVLNRARQNTNGIS
jgi:hypothetical protein